jgi:hypothetical protein
MDAREKVRFMGPPLVSESPLDATSIARNAEDVAGEFWRVLWIAGKIVPILTAEARRDPVGGSAPPR